MVRLLHVPQRDGDTLLDALKERMADLPAALLRSITWDQGTEMGPSSSLRHGRVEPAVSSRREC
jgi:transposase, IS30 family